MKCTIFSLILTFNTILSYGQNETAKLFPTLEKTRIQTEVEKEAIKFKKTLSKESLTTEQIAFSIDTFKIWLTNTKRQLFDNSTEGMNNSVNEMAASYEQLMNKYYIKLLKFLEPQDKEILVSSQKVWLKFRETEKKLIWLMTKEKYSIGGTVQINVAVGNYFDLIKTRTDQIFNYFHSIIEKNS